MQIVIEISDEMYDDIIHDNPTDIPKIIADRIKNGTPLPKGHGNLIDYGYIVDAIDDWINAEEYCYTNATYYLRKRIGNVPTIIEEDKEW